MAKIIVWLIVIFVVLLALRMINARKARSRTGDGAQRTGAPKAEPMVRCVRCSVFLPRAEAKPVDGGYACIEGPCAKR